MLNGLSGKHVDDFWSLKELKVLKLKQYFLRDETAETVTWKIRQMADIANISVTSLGYSVWCALDPVSSTGAWLDRPLNWGTKWKALPKLLLLKLQQRGLEIINRRRRFDTVRGFFSICVKTRQMEFFPLPASCVFRLWDPLPLLYSHYSIYIVFCVLFILRDPFSTLHSIHMVYFFTREI